MLEVKACLGLAAGHAAASAVAPAGIVGKELDTAVNSTQVGAGKDYTIVSLAAVVQKMVKDCRRRIHLKRMSLTKAATSMKD